MSQGDREIEIYRALETGKEPTIRLTPAIRRALGAAMQGLRTGNAADCAVAEIVQADMEAVGLTYVCEYHFAIQADLETQSAAAADLGLMLD